MKKKILLIIGLLLILPFVKGTAQRNLGSTTTTPGGSISISYSVSPSPWGVEEKLPSGWRIRTSQTCSQLNQCDWYQDANNYLYECIGGYCTFQKNINGISKITSLNPGIDGLYLVASGTSGSYSIGPSNYQAGISETGTIPSVSLTVNGTCTSTCASLGYECGTWDICGTSTNCGTCTLPLICGNGQCVSICTQDSDCASGESCSSGKCVTPEKCEFWEKKVGSTCEINTGIIVIGFILLFALKMFSN